jgi:2-polyprenyl-3-methyl-5-hydroxy-6-metoxy-1,4-benzoquinol methylase
LQTFRTPVWSPSEQYEKVAEANRQFYARFAHHYETSETCVTDPTTQQYLERTLDDVLAHLAWPAEECQVLDACGGTGNVALKLLKRGLDVTLTDISEDQLDIFESKCATHQYQPRIVCAEVGSFLAQSAEQFDLIVFSSALHHLENVQGVLELCFEALRPGGLLFTIHDPTSAANRTALARLALRMDYLMFKCIDQFSDLPSAIGRRLKRILSGASAKGRQEMALNEATMGVLAEYHATRGIDDLQLVAELREIGFDVVWHKRRAGSRYRLPRKLVEWTGEKTEFELLLRKPD